MDAGPLDRDGLRDRVQLVLDRVVAHQRGLLLEVDPACAALVDAVARLVSGGKRLRAAFAYWGWRGAGGDDRDEVVEVGAALELFQAAALLHDDVIDGSDTRRGRPAAHRVFETMHRDAGWDGDSVRFGTAAAVLAGDLCLAWSGELLSDATAELPPARRTAGRQVYDRMSTQLMGGQYLDVLVQSVPGAPPDQALERARRVIRFKTVHYTVEHPLHLGAHLAGGSDALVGALSAYAAVVGEAFQLRDDVLGVFGDPQVTGKPVGDDLREGKRTVLLALARRAATPSQREVLDALVGDPDLGPEGVDRLREIITVTGALGEVETMIEKLADEAYRAAAAAPLVAPAGEVLADLVGTATRRAA
jgi:geranylgeranyl diphosphate synthase type I